MLKKIILILTFISIYPQSSNAFTIASYFKQKNITKKHIDSIKSYNTAVVEYLTLKTSKEKIKAIFKKGKLSFIISGINATKSNEMIDFKNKFNVDFIFESCALNPLTYNKIKTHNKIVSGFLTNYFGTNWKTFLPFKPLGVI